MEIKINIDEQYVTELVSQEIANRIVNERTYENREVKIMNITSQFTRITNS